MEGKVATDEERPTVQEVKKKFSVFEDGAYAHQVQEELNVEHYQGNISRRRTVRSDLVVAKSQAETEALEAFREEHEIAERNRKIEERDKEAAKEMYQKMMKEEEEKEKQEQERDKEIAREMQQKEKEEYIRLKKKQIEREKLMESERLAKSLTQEADNPEDALASMRIAEEKERSNSGSLRVDIDNKVPDVTDDELIAKQLQEHEKDKYLLAKKKHKENKTIKESERLAMRLQQEEKLKAERQRVRSMEGEDEIKIRRVPGTVDDDEMFARQIHREEVQRAISQGSEEDRLRRELHDAELARRMQHEEVVRAKMRRHQRDALMSETSIDMIRSEVFYSDDDDNDDDIILLSVRSREDEDMDRNGPHQGRGHHDSERNHRPDPDRGHRPDPERGHPTDPVRDQRPASERNHCPESGRSNRHDSGRAHRPDSERSHRPDSERSHRPDSERSHRPDSERSHRPDSERSHRPDSERSHRPDDERIHRYEDRRQDRRHDQREREQPDQGPTSRQGGGVDPRLMERNPMVDAYHLSEQVHDPGRGQMQPIPGQKRQTTKEREKPKEKDKKSKGFFSKSKKK